MTVSLQRWTNFIALFELVFGVIGVVLTTLTIVLCSVGEMLQPFSDSEGSHVCANETRSCDCVWYTWMILIFSAFVIIGHSWIIIRAYLTINNEGYLHSVSKLPWSCCIATLLHSVMLILVINFNFPEYWIILLFILPFRLVSFLLAFGSLEEQMESETVVHTTTVSL